MELGTLFLEFTKSRHGEVSAWLGVSLGQSLMVQGKFFNMNFMTLTATLAKSEFVVEAIMVMVLAVIFKFISFLFYNSSKLSCCPLPN